METGVEKQVNGIIPSFPRRNKQRKGEAGTDTGGCKWGVFSLFLEV